MYKQWLIRIMLAGFSNLHNEKTCSTAPSFYMHFINFFFFFNSVLRPFQDYFSSYETGQSVGGRKRENPEKKHLAHPQAELGLSDVASAGLEPAPVR